MNKVYTGKKVDILQYNLKVHGIVGKGSIESICQHVMVHTPLGSVLQAKVDLSFAIGYLSNPGK